MAINKRFTQLNNSGSNHNLLDALSGKITGSFEVTGAAHFPGGLSGSLTTLENGSPFIIGTGTITVTSVSNGAITLFGTATSVPEYWASETANEIYTSASLVNVPSGSVHTQFLSASNGMEVTGSAFFNDGVTLGSSNADIITVNGQLTASYGVAVTGYAVFNDNVTLGSSNADVVTVNAQLTASAGLELTGSSTFAAGSTFTFNGDGVFVAGLTGSLQEVSAGVPYLLAGDYITLATNSLGQIAISASNLYWQSDVANVIYTTGSIEVTGSATFNPAGTGRGLLNVGGLDIGPITGSAFTSDAGIGGYSPNTILSGNLLSASFGVWQPGAAAMLRHELHVVGFGQNLIAGGLYNTFAATYLVSSFIDAAGNQNIIGATELSRETSGSNAATWDVNFAVNGDIEVSGVLGSTGNGLSDIVNWYGQRVKEMSINISGSRT